MCKCKFGDVFTCVICNRTLYTMQLYICLILCAGVIPQPYKSLLIQHAQKVWKQQPLYLTINEGSGHAPKFRCTVLVDGVSYTSPDTFQQRKTAEMDASRITYFDLLQKLKNEALRLVREVCA